MWRLGLIELAVLEQCLVENKIATISAAAIIVATDDLKPTDKLTSKINI